MEVVVGAFGLAVVVVGGAEIVVAGVEIVVVDVRVGVHRHLQRVAQLLPDFDELLEAMTYSCGADWQVMRLYLFHSRACAMAAFWS